MNVGIEIGGTKLQLVVGDENGAIHEWRRLKVDAGNGAAGIREQIAEEWPGLLAGRRISQVGVGFGGPVAWKTGKICRSHQVEGWSDFDLGGWLKNLSGVAVFVENDANTAALGEARRGAGLGFNPVFYVTLGSGVGGGLVVDGQIYHGATPGESEIGHVRLDRQGTVLEARCSGWAVDARIRELSRSAPGGLLAQLVGPEAGGEARHLPTALARSDAAAKRVLEDTAQDLALGLSHAVHLFHPEIIVLGGGLSQVGEPLRLAVEEALSRFTMDAFAPGPRLALTALGEDAVPVGALMLGRA